MTDVGCLTRLWAVPFPHTDSTVVLGCVRLAADYEIISQRTRKQQFSDTSILVPASTSLPMACDLEL